LHPPKFFTSGTKVKLANFRGQKDRVRKWLVKWTGPYIVVDMVGPVNCRIFNPDPKAVKPIQVVSISHLQEYHDELESNFDVQDEIDEYQSDSNPPHVQKSFFTLSESSHRADTDKAAIISERSRVIRVTESQSDDDIDETEVEDENESESEPEIELRRSTRESRRPSHYGDNIYDRRNTTI